MEVSVSLNKAHFYAKHGYYAFEQQTGNEFEVTLKCSYQNSGAFFVNYEDLFIIAKEIMHAEMHLQLIEELAENMMTAIHERFSFLTKIKVEIIKLTPPIPQFKGAGASVTLKWKQ